MQRIKIGILRETKTPPDHRVALTPSAVTAVRHRYPHIEIVAQPSPIRCFTDQEYLRAGIALQEDLSDCDWLVGVKEVSIPALIPGKKYLFFAHVAKQQAYNRNLLREIIRQRITLVDYEYLKDAKNNRLIAFGRWAGIIGSFNGLRAWGIRTGRFRLEPPHHCTHRKDMDEQLTHLDVGPVRILVTGGGRVALGAMETLRLTGIPEVTPEEYLSDPDRSPLICRIDPCHYVEAVDGQPFRFEHFVEHPSAYRSTFLRYARSTDLLIAAHFWDPSSPRFWDLEEMAGPEFRIRVIADISCDINGAVPSTIRATSIHDPFYDWDPAGRCERPPFSDPGHITVMSIDNLPGELPRDASDAFSQVMINRVFPCLFDEDPCEVIERATITRDGQLNGPFRYLESFAEED